MTNFPDNVEGFEAGKPPDKVQPPKKLSTIPLMFLIFYEVSGGPFGVEPSVQAGGPLLALLGFLLFPLIWSIPEALTTAELATAFPENGGYVVWVSAAFGSFWGFQEGWWKWLSGVIDNTLYPILFLDYLKWVLPSVGGGVTRLLSLLVITFGLTYFNYRGLTIVGYTAVALGIFSLLPFCIMALLATPRLRPTRWLVINLDNVDWRVFMNTLFWNLNYWDSASTLAGEVENPQKSFPKALTFAVFLVMFSYLIPLLAGTGTLKLDIAAWSDGYFAVVANQIGGPLLKWWVAAAAALSNAGLFEAEMSSDSFQLLGMREIGMLPQIFARRSKFGTPTLGVIFSGTGVVLLSWLRFQEIVEILNFLYCLGMLLEFAAFIWLRVKQPNLLRPYQVPFGTLGVVLVSIPPILLIVVVMTLASFKTVVLSFLCSAVGFLLYPCLMYLKQKNWITFVKVADAQHLSSMDGSASLTIPGQDDFDSETGLLHEQRVVNQEEIG